MKNHSLVALLSSLLILCLSGCSLFAAKQKQPTPFPSLVGLPSPTALVPLPATIQPTPLTTLVLPTVAPASGAQPVNLVPTPVQSGIVPGAPSGPYGVIGVLAGDSLNIRSNPGVNYPVVGNFPPTANTVMRTGPSTNVDGALWVEVQTPSGGRGWVHSGFLTEYVAPASFCGDARAAALVANFAAALKTSNGTALAALVSPSSGWTVKLWRNGNAVVFDRSHAQWIFTSTYSHDWGAAPGSGLEVTGSIHSVVLPKLLDVFNAPAPGYTLACNAVQAGGASYDTSWPAAYANINYYSLYKAGPAGNENSWRTVLVGIEYVQGTPYLFNTTQLDWEP